MSKEISFPRCIQMTYSIFVIKVEMEKKLASLKFILNSRYQIFNCWKCSILIVQVFWVSMVGIVTLILNIYVILQDCSIYFNVF